MYLFVVDAKPNSEQILLRLDLEKSSAENASQRSLESNIRKAKELAAEAQQHLQRNKPFSLKLKESKSIYKYLERISPKHLSFLAKKRNLYERKEL